MTSAAWRVLVLCGLLGAAPARAEEAPDYFRTGLYAGASAVVGVSSFDGQVGDSTTTVGGAARFGYRLTPIFGIELAAEAMDDFAESTLAPPGVAQSVVTQSVRIWQVSGNIRGNADLRGLAEALGRVQPYGVIGVGYYQAWIHAADVAGVPNRSIHDGMARLGLGVDVFLTERIVVAVEGRYNALFNRQEGLDYWSFDIGPQLHF